MVIELAMRVAKDEDLTPQERLAALWPLIDRGYVRPPAGLDVAVTQGETRTYNLDALSLDETRALLEKIDAAELPESTEQGTE